MKQYYYSENDRQFGPFTIFELKTKRIRKSTLVWTDGLQNWTVAESIDELKDILVPEPPTLPKKSNTSPTIESIQIKQAPNPLTSSKYEHNYKKDLGATVIGVIILVVTIVINLLHVPAFETFESYNNALFYVTFISFLIRIFATLIAVDIANQQNRKTKIWGWFAFFFPSITLIIIGLLKKLRLKFEVDRSLPSNIQVSILFKKAKQLFSDNRYSECIEILNSAIEIENQNFECIRLRGLANFRMKNYGNSKTDFETLIKNEKFLSDANLYLGKLAIIEKNRELAVSYWLKSDKLENEAAKKYLGFFYSYSGKYLLDKRHVMKKVNFGSEVIQSMKGKYQGGLHQIDQIEKPGFLKTQIIIYGNGLYIKLKRIFKEFHLGIAYYEIDSIVFKEADNKLELHLADKIILTFSYDQTKDDYKSLKLLFKMFKEATGMTLDAASG